MKYIVSLIGHTFFNPILFIYFSFSASAVSENIYIKGEGTNIYHLNFTIYFLFSLISAVLIYSLVKLYNRFSKNQVHLKEIVQTKHFYLQLFAYAVTILTLKSYSDGMEGNIMGFIFFPMLIFGSVAISLPYLSFLFKRFHIGKQNLDLNLRTRMLIHLFNPLLLSSLLPMQEPELKDSGIILELIAVILTITITYVFFLSIHWALFKILKKPFAISEYFGENETLNYYLPFIYGGFVFIRNGFLLKQEWFAKFELLNIFHFPMMVFIILILFMNYIRYLQKRLFVP